MTQERLSVPKIKEVLRLKFGSGLSHRQIASSCNIAHSTVADYLKRAALAGLSWPLPEGLSDDALQERLAGAVVPPTTVPSPKKPLPDFAHIHRELRSHEKLNLTLDLLWREYKDQYPDGYQYTQFSWLYRQWRGRLDLVMRQTHKAGEKVFVDYGEGLSITNPQTGEQIPTELFVAVWGLSNYTFAEATLTQALPAWTMSHVHAFDYFGCVPRILVPDNLKSGVTKPCYYEPDINPVYAELAAHYSLAVIPARPYHARDKAKVEAGVLVAKRWILAALRHHIFYSLEELNNAIAGLLEKLNTRLLRKMKKSRRDLFTQQDRPNARTLPSVPYQYAEWKKATVNIDYHIEIDKHYYSVPCQYVHKSVDIRFTAATLEIFFKGQRLTAHARSFIPYKHTTLKDHMPLAHQEHANTWNPERLLKWAETIGPHTVWLLKEIMSHRQVPEQGYRSCLGIMRLSKAFSKERIEAAALRAVEFKAFSFRSVKSILLRKLDQSPKGSSPKPLPKNHANIRGAAYYGDTCDASQNQNKKEGHSNA